MKKLTSVLILIAAVMIMVACEKVKSDESLITSFSFGNPPVEGVIDNDSKTIELTVPSGTNLMGLVPMINIPKGATVSPGPGEEVDFTNPVKFTITSEGGSITVYLVIVKCDDKKFTDSRGNEIETPSGAISFAKKVVSFTHGTPWTSDPAAMDPQKITGIPDYKNEENYITLGSAGVIVVEFGVYISDGAGNDIYVFEIGPDVEATKVEVSEDLNTWIFIGNADGSLSGVDVAGKIPKNGKFKYVRLTDLKSYPHTTWAGADIDAVGVIYPVKF